MGSISLALLPATAHRAGGFRDLSVTTPEPQLPLPSLAQRHCLDYSPCGHHRAPNLACPLSNRSTLWATFGDVCHWHSIWLSKRASYLLKPWKSTARSLSAVHWWRRRCLQESTQERLGPHASCILLYWTSFPWMYLFFKSTETLDSQGKPWQWLPESHSAAYEKAPPSLCLLWAFT